MWRRVHDTMRFITMSHFLPSVWRNIDINWSQRRPLRTVERSTHIDQRSCQCPTPYFGSAGDRYDKVNCVRSLRELWKFTTHRIEWWQRFGETLGSWKGFGPMCVWGWRCFFMFFTIRTACSGRIFIEDGLHGIRWIWCNLIYCAKTSCCAKVEQHHNYQTYDACLR